MGGFNNQTAVKQPAFGRRASPPASSGFVAPTPLPPQGGPAPGFDTKHIVGRGFWLISRNAITFLALVAAAAAPNRIVYHLPVAHGGVFWLVYFASTLLVCAPLYGAIFCGAMRTLRGEAVTFAACLRAGLHLRPAAALLSLMTALFLWLLLILPAFGLATRYAIAAPLAIAEGLGVRAATARSAALTARCRGPVRKLVFLLAGLAIARALPMLPVWGVPVEALPLFLFGNWLFPLLLTALAAATSASLYDALAKQSAVAASTPKEKIANPE